MPGRASQYNPTPLQALLNELLARSGESQRAASLAAGLNHNAIWDYLRGRRPMRDPCIVLAVHFGINPNEMLEAAGYDPLPVFDPSLAHPGQMRPDAIRLARKFQELKDPKIRRRLLSVVEGLIDEHIRLQTDSQGTADC